MFGIRWLIWGDLGKLNVEWDDWRVDVKGNNRNCSYIL